MAVADDKGAKPVFNLSPTSYSKSLSAYEQWIQSTGVPIHRGFFIDDVRTVELGWWDERQCNAAFLVLSGQEGVTEGRVTEIAPGATVPPVKFGLDEVAYVAEGRGLTTLWTDDGHKTSFEWDTHSMFLLPRHTNWQLSNTRGDRPARIVHYNYLPLTMNAIPDLDFLFNNPHSDPGALDHGYSEAKVSRGDDAFGGMGFWTGNFFADMRAWDKLDPYRGRGAGGHVVWVQFPTSPIWAHMSVFPARSYKKAHRHGPGVLIVIPGGEGFSVMWEEGQEKVFIPWHEGSVFVPPDRWFHQHFNVAEAPARYLAMHAPRGLGRNENVENIIRDQIEYPDEDPWIRQTFEGELSKRGLTSLMPAEAYQNRSFEWKY